MDYLGPPIVELSPSLYSGASNLVVDVCLEYVVKVSVSALKDTSIVERESIPLG